MIPFNEQWRDIRGYEGRYQVSNYGRVRFLTLEWQLGPTKVCIVGRVMLTFIASNGYVEVTLRRPREPKKKFYVHRLVATAFIPNPQQVEIVNHKDRDRANNGVSNLEWVTASENTTHWMKDNERREQEAAGVF